MKRLGLAWCALALGSWLLLAGGNPAQAADPVVLKLSHHVPLTHPLQPLSETIAKDVLAQSGGKLKIEVYGAGQLGGLKDNTEGVSYGTLDMALVDYGSISTTVPQAAVIGLPFLFSSYAQVEKFFDGEIGTALNKIILEKTKIRILKMTHSGFRVIGSNKPITKLEDMKLIKIRVPEIPVYVNTMKALGANPTPIPWGELYTSLQTGVVEACEIPTETMFTGKIYEVAKNLVRTNHIYTDIGFTINEGVYQKLPDDLKKVLVDAINARVKEHRAEVAANDEAFFKKLVDAGMKPTTADLAPFVAAVKPVWDDFIAKANAGELVKQIQALK
jgi:tripartite ATP-independent transporter DctP family solute receptor